MSHYCIFCIDSETPNDLDYSVICKRFLELFNRYNKKELNVENVSHFQFLIEQAISAGMIVCEKCGEIMKLFCDQYHQLEIIKLRLNWTIERFKERVELSSIGQDGFSEMVKGLKVDSLYWINECELIEMVNDFKTALVEQCSQKLIKALPKVSLKTSLSEELSTPVMPEWAEVFPGSNNPGSDVEHLLNADLINISSKYPEISTKDIFSEGKGEEIVDSSKLSIMKAERIETEHRLLRSIHRCKNCKRTFSSQARLTRHNLECNQDKICQPLETFFKSDINEFGDGVTNEISEREGDDYDDDLSEATFSSDSSTESEVETEVKPKIEIQTALKGQSKVKKAKWLSANNYRYKCPSCASLFLHLHLMLVHNKNHLESSSESQINVEILKFEINSEIPACLSENSTNYEVAAVIKVSSDIFICPEPSCQEPFYDQNDMAMHSKLHGPFQCKFCPVVEASSENLAEHELTHVENNPSKILKCSRCPSKFSLMSTYSKHHLKVHLSMACLSFQKCAICRMPQSHRRDWSWATLHYISHHNLKLKGVLKIHHCKYKNCNAYATTSRNLHRHRMKVHFKKPEYSKHKSTHQRKHTWSDYKFKCPDCKSKFSQIYKLLCHFKAVHFSEAGTNKDFINVEVLSRPRLSLSYYTLFAIIRVTPEIHFCPLSNCEQPFYSRIALEFHSKLHGNFKCHFCSEEFDYAPVLSEHELSHANENLLERKCPRCDYSSIKKMLCVRHHLTEHLGMVPMIRNTCPVCMDDVACNQRNLFRHFKDLHDIKDVDPEALHKCDVKDCPAYYTNPNGLTNHKTLQHVHLECKDCGKRFYGLKRRITLQKHRFDNHPDKLLGRIPCTIKDCDFIGEIQEDVDWHLRKAHHGRVTVECPKCQKSFKQLKYRDSHLRHRACEPKILKLICELCGIRFRDKDHLQRHQLSHSGPESWEFTCDVCNKKCMDKNKLVVHLRTHSKDKSFVCDICGAKYKHRHNLRIHVNSKHGDVVKDVARKFNWRDGAPMKKAEKKK